MWYESNNILIKTTTKKVSESFTKNEGKGSEWLSVGIRAWSEELAGELNFWIDSLVAIIRSRGLVLLTIVTLRG